jgi:hypothetical protein
VIEALKSNNDSAGGSVLQRGSMSFVIRGSGSIQSLRDIGNTYVKSVGGTPIFLRDVANVDLDHLSPFGIFSKDYTDEGVEGIVLMRRGENPSQVLAAVNAVVAELNESELPPSVWGRPVLRPPIPGRCHAAHRHAQRLAGHHPGGASVAAVLGPAGDGRPRRLDHPGWLCSLPWC